MAGESGKRKNWIAIIVAIIALVVVVCVVVAIGLAKRSKSGSQLEDNVSIYEPGKSQLQINSMDKDSLTVSGANGIQKGSVIAAGITKVTPDGLLRKVIDVKNGSNGKAILATKPAALTDAIKRCDVHVVSRLVNGRWQVTTTDRLAPEKSDVFFGLFGTKNANAAEIHYLFDKKEDKYYAKVGLGFDADLKVTPQSQADKVKRIRFSVVSHIDLRAGFTGKLVGKYKIPLLDKDLKPSEFLVDGLPVVLTHHVGADVTFNGELDDVYTRVGFVVAPSLGFVYESNKGFKPVSERGEETGLKSNEFMVGNNGKIVGKTNDGIEFTYNPMLYGVAGAEVYAGALCDINADLTPLTDDYDTSTDTKNKPIILTKSNKKYVGELNGREYFQGKVTVKLAELSNPFDGKFKNLMQGFTDYVTDNVNEKIDDVNSFLDKNPLFDSELDLLDPKTKQPKWTFKSISQSYHPKELTQLNGLFRSRTDGYGFDFFQFNIPSTWKESQRQQVGSDADSYSLVELKGNGFTVFYKEFDDGGSSASFGGGNAAVAQSYRIEKIADTKFSPSDFVGSGKWNVSGEDRQLKLVVVKITDSQGHISVAVASDKALGDNMLSQPYLYTHEFNFLNAGFEIEATGDNGTLTDVQVDQISKAFATLRMDNQA